MTNIHPHKRTYTRHTQSFAAKMQQAGKADLFELSRISYFHSRLLGNRFSGAREVSFWVKALWLSCSFSCICVFCVVFVLVH